MKKSGYKAPRRPSRSEFKGVRVALLATRWNTEIVDALGEGARRALADWGVAKDNISEFRVAGAFELPVAARMIAHSERFEGVVALGVVIRGDTPHFDIVAGECSRGLREVSQQGLVPLGFGVLTVETAQQAYERAGKGSDNKGYESAVAMLETLRLKRQLHG